MQKKKAGEEFTANVSLVQFWGEVCTEVVNLTNKLVQNLHLINNNWKFYYMQKFTFFNVLLSAACCAYKLTNQLTWLM